jgi:general secretion pathway protein A
VREKRHTIIIVDEAQVIADYETFEELRLLLNFQLNDRFLITLFLVGQPELNDMVQKIPQLNQRVAVRFHLKRFSLDETKAYIQYRLKVVGGTNNLCHFAITKYFSTRRALPELLNNICDLSLVIGSREKYGHD